MYRSVNSLLRPLSAARALPVRQIHAGAVVAQKKEQGGYPSSLTQGHAADKASDPMHGAADVQSEGVVKARDTKAKAGTGQEPGMDTAKESGINGHAEAHPSEGTGALKDHRGDQQRVGQKGWMGPTEEAAGGSTGDSILKAIGLGGKKTPAEKKGKGFHTSARSYMPEDDKLAGARKPKEQKLEGEQNQHLKHKSDTSAPDSGKGNAGPNPTLPSKSGGRATGQKRSFASSARARANEDDPLKQDVNKDEPNSLGVKPTEEGHNQDGKAQDKAAKGNNKPGLPQGEKEKAAKGMTRGLHTSARAWFGSSGRAMANEDDPLKQDVHKDEPLSSTMKPTEEGHNQAGTGKAEDKAAKGNTKPGLPQGEKDKAAKGMTRGLHTSARAFAQRTDPGYVAAVEGEPNSSKNAPPTGLPQELGAAYKDSAYKPASKAAEPSSKVDFSSTATAKPNEALKQAAKDGTLADRNEQPDTPKYGKIGLDDGWKERKHQ